VWYRRLKGVLWDKFRMDYAADCWVDCGIEFRMDYAVDCLVGCVVDCRLFSGVDCSVGR
jgi:hypothetical protein